MKTLRLLFGLFVIGATALVAWRVVPVYLNNYQFQESIDDSARMGAVNQQESEDDIRNEVYQQAQNLSIPLRQEDIRVQRTSGGVLISADYVVHVELPMYPLDLSFHPSSNRESLTFK